MKRKLLLIPITLTALAPTISMVGCGDPDAPQPENYIVLDQYNNNEISSGHLTKPVILPDTLYYFKIDMEKWDGSRTASEYSELSFRLDTQPDNDYLVKDDLEIYIDGNLLDIDKVNIYKQPYEPYNEWLVFDASCYEDLLNANTITGQVKTGSSQSTGESRFYFKGIKK